MRKLRNPPFITHEQAMKALEAIDFRDVIIEGVPAPRSLLERVQMIFDLMYEPEEKDEDSK